MEKEFIPYEQALALKELGFDEECLGTYYEEDKSFYINGVSYSNSYFTKAQELIPEHPQITTPTFSQAFRWFREKYDLIYFITPEGRINNRCYLYSIKDWKAFVGTFGQTYEQAELECLKKLIEIVKTK